MTFLTDSDFDTQMYRVFFSEITSNEPDSLTQIVATQIAYMRSKLKTRYDVDAIFSAIGADRNLLIVEHLTALVICKLIGKNAARKMPSDVKESCKEAREWLKDVRDYKESPDLPVPVEDTPSIVRGSGKNKNWYY